MVRPNLSRGGRSQRQTNEDLLALRLFREALAADERHEASRPDDLALEAMASGGFDVHVDTAEYGEHVGRAARDRNHETAADGQLPDERRRGARSRGVH